MINGFDNYAHHGFNGFNGTRFDDDENGNEPKRDGRGQETDGSTTQSAQQSGQNAPVRVDTGRVENGAVRGLACLKGIKINTGSNGKPYAMGQVSVPSGSADFRIWGAPARMDDGVYAIDAKWHEYKGSWQLNVSSFTKVDGDPADYEYAPYDVQLLGERANRIIADRVSPDGRRLLNLLIHGNGDMPDLDSEFKSAQAAISHHDNVRGGLFAHSYKTLHFLAAILDCGLYPGIPCDNQSFRDIVLVGGLMHDIGKTIEYDGSSMSGVGKILSHRIIGAERVILMRGDIIPLIGEEGYERLLAVMMQHHGEFEETPRCIEAYIVHLADSLDTKLTTLSEARGGAMQGEPVRVDGFQLS